MLPENTGLKNTNNYFFPLTLFIVCLILFFTGLGSYGLLAKDEPRYAECALEMIYNNDWTVPKFNFENRFDKPPLFYWLIAVSYILFGVNEFAVRLPSAICATLLVFFTFYFSKKLFGEKAGFLSALILASSAEYLYLGRRAATDIVLCLFFSTALYLIFLAVNETALKKKLFWSFISAIFTGLGILTKGPVALVLLLLIIGIYLLTSKSFTALNIFSIAVSAVVGILISLPWYFTVHFATSGEFTRVFFLEHNVSRFTSVVGRHPGPVWFYIPVILGGFFPWIIFLFTEMFLILKKLIKDFYNNTILLCILWSLAVFLFFSFSVTKLATYIILVFPPLALITGYWLSLISENNINLIKKMIFTLAILLVIAFPFAYYFISKSNLNIYTNNALLHGILTHFILLIFMMFIITLNTKKITTLISGFVFSLGLPAVLILNLFLTSYYDYSFTELKNFALKLKKSNAEEIIAFDMFQPLLVFYSGLHVNFKEKNKQLIYMEKAMNAGKNLYVIIPKKYLKNDGLLTKKHQKLFKALTIIDSGRRHVLCKLTANS